MVAGHPTAFFPCPRPGLVHSRRGRSYALPDGDHLGSITRVCPHCCWFVFPVTPSTPRARQQHSRVAQSTPKSHRINMRRCSGALEGSPRRPSLRDRRPQKVTRPGFAPASSTLEARPTNHGACSGYLRGSARWHACRLHAFPGSTMVPIGSEQRTASRQIRGNLPVVHQYGR